MPKAKPVSLHPFRSMKLSKPLLALILIQSALLLSAESPRPSATAPSKLRPTAENSQTQKAYDQTATHDQHTRPTPSRVGTWPTPLLKQGAGRNTEEGKYQAAQYRLNRVQALFNGLLVLFTAALVGVGGWQARRLRQTVEATKDTAEAAKKSADVAEKQLRHIERPWITFETTELQGTKYIVDRIKRLQPALIEPEDSPSAEIIRLRVCYRFNNCGRTPARLIAGSIQLICADPKTLQAEPFYPRISTPESLMPPGTSAVNSLVVQLFPPNFEKFVRGRESLIIYGFVEYRDMIVEGNDSLHESRFRMECSFPGFDILGAEEVSLGGPFYFAFAGSERYNRYT